MPWNPGLYRTVVAVVPVARAERMLASAAGWSSGRTNGFTQTVERTFSDADAAHAAAARLPKGVVWGLEAVSP